MAKFWVGGTGNWSDNTNHWSDTDGGSPGATAPGATDDCIINDNSFSGTFALTVDTTVTIQSMDWSSITEGSNVSLARSSGIIHVTGDVTFRSNTTMTVSNLAFDFTTASGNTSILTMNNGQFDGSTTWTFNRSGAILSIGSNILGGGISGVALSAGTLNTNNYQIKVPVMAINGGTANLGSSLIWLTSGSVQGFSVAVGATINAGTSTIRLDGSSGLGADFGGKTFYRVELYDTNNFINDCGATFDYLYFAPPAGVNVNYQLEDGGCSCGSPVITTRVLDAQGTAGHTITFTKFTGSGTLYIKITGSSLVDYVIATDIDASCGNPIANPNGTDGGGNTNILFGEGAVWFEGIPGAHYKKPQMDDVNVPVGQLKGIDTLKPQASIVNERKPLLT